MAWLRTRTTTTTFGHGAQLYEPQTSPGCAGGHAARTGDAARGTRNINDAIRPEPVILSVGMCTTGDQEPRDSNGAEASGGAHGSHVLTRTAHVIWCTRLGVGLQRPCVGVATGAYPARIERLRSGRNPISGAPLRDTSTVGTECFAFNEIPLT